MLSLIEQIDKVSKGSDTLVGVKLSIMKTPGIVHGWWFIDFDKSCFIFVTVRVGGDVLPSTFIPTLEQTGVIIHFKLSN